MICAEILFDARKCQENLGCVAEKNYYYSHFMALWTLYRTTRVSQYRKVHFIIFPSKALTQIL